ncbi:MAG: aldehyde dehydrogenase family protein [Bordetella sp.]|nr:aldehyde dehydrogenase family protein [Bordetella sp.]
MKHSLIAGQWVGDAEPFVVQDKFLLRPFAEVAAASRAQVAQAVAGLKEAARGGAPAPAERAAHLRQAAQILGERRKLFIDTMVAEAGFTLPDASTEVDRAQITLQLCAEEAPRLVGDVVPFAASPGAHNRLGFTLRSPLGVVCAITPFNSPLNTVLHKVGPAYAAGNAVALKPSALTPLTAAHLGQVLLDAGLPADFLAILQGEGDSVGRWLLEEQDIAFYTFTGSTRVGRIIQDAAGLRRTQMELGSIASTLVCASADQDKAAEKIANAAFRKAGQVCTSVQRLYVHADIFESFTAKLMDCAGRLPAGDPRLPETRVGPLISEAAAIRSERWIAEAVELGARRHCGGTRHGAVLTPTLMTEVGDAATVWCQEAFAPVLAVRPFHALAEAVEDANRTPYGLAAGIFSADIHECMFAMRNLRFGTVQINETSSARSDVMPFGGVKDSGFGKEGPWHAMREMSEERLVVINP